MPSILKVRVVSAIGLPSTYVSVSVELRLDPRQPPFQAPFASPTTEGGAVPSSRGARFEWNDDFRFEISDDTVLQDMPLECRVLGRETIVGVVFVDLNPLLVESGAGQLAGSFPVYNVGMGVQGELVLQAKLEVFGDRNPWKYSSAGVDLFAMHEAPQLLPDGRSVTSIIGLVDAMLLLPKESTATQAGEPRKRPSHRTSNSFWADSKMLRRASAGYDRERTLFMATGELRRLVGLKAMEVHANAVVGLECYFDFEHTDAAGDGVIVRAIGTGIRLSSAKDSIDELRNSEAATPHPSEEEEDANAGFGVYAGYHPALATSAIPLLTITRMPAGTLRSIGGVVSAKNVKLLSRSRSQLIASNVVSELELRQEWFDEMRHEIREHARLLRCNVVYGYSEQVAIYDDLFLVMAHGTAARCDFSQLVQHRTSSSTSGLDDPHHQLVSSEESTANDAESIDSRIARRRHRRQKRRERRQAAYLRHQGNIALFICVDCSACHLPYRRARSPFPGAFSWCRLCQRRHVPEVLFSTAALPFELDCLKDRTLVEAYVCRPLDPTTPHSPAAESGKEHLQASTAAVLLSTALPFVEYELHRQLLYRLRLVGANAVFSIQYRLAIHDAHVIAIATGTAVCLSALPPPEALRCIRTLPLPEGHCVSEIERALETLSLDNEQRVRSALSKNPKIRSAKDGGALHTNSSGSSSSRSDESSSGSSSDSSTSSSSSSSSGSRSSTNDPLSFVQIDDEADLDVLETLQISPPLAFGNIRVSLSSTDELPPVQPETGRSTVLSFPCHAIKQLSLPDKHNSSLATIFGQVRDEAIREHLRRHRPQSQSLVVSAIDYRISSLRRGKLQVEFSAVIYEHRSFTDTAVAEPSNTPPANHVLISPGTRLPNSVLLDHKGHIAIHVNRDLLPGLPPSSILADLLRLARAEVVALGGNVLVGACVDYVHTRVIDSELDRQAMEMSISGDVQRVEMDASTQHFAESLLK